RFVSSRRSTLARRGGSATPAQLRNSLPAFRRTPHRFKQVPRSTDHARGLAIAAAGGLALTVDIPLIRLADGNHWSVLLLRSGTTFCATLALWYCWRRFAGSAPRLLPGLPGLWVACLYGLASVAFMAAVYHTSTAN